jgi:hypothetical protein
MLIDDQHDKMDHEMEFSENMMRQSMLGKAKMPEFVVDIHVASVLR